MIRYIPGSRLALPEPLLAWPLLILGAALIVCGTLCAMKVRRHMHAGDGWGERLLKTEGGILGYLIHEYDEPDRPFLLAGLLGRVIGGVALIWAGIALFVL